MNIQSIPASQQWAEIQRVAQERTLQRNKAVAQEQQSQHLHRGAAGNGADVHQELQRLRTIFTKNGTVQQNYIPKGMLFDQRG